MDKPLWPYNTDQSRTAQERVFGIVRPWNPMDAEKAVELFWLEVGRSSLREVAKDAGIPHSTAAGWREGVLPEGKNRRRIIEWAEKRVRSAPPPEVLQRAQESTQRNLVRLSEISGYAKGVLEMMVAVTDAQRRVVDSLAPWVIEEEAVDPQVLEDAVQDVIADSQRVAAQQGKAKGAAGRRRSAGA